MRKIAICVLLAVIAAGCSNQAAKTAAEPLATPTNKAHESKPSPVDPLLDPSSPLAQRNVYFDFDSSEISGDGLLLLQVHAQYLMEHAADKIEVEGNTDERGSTAYNLALGERRAIAVRKFLVSRGVREGRVAIASYGKEKPVANCHDESCWKKNRRAFIKY